MITKTPFTIDRRKLLKVGGSLAVSLAAPSIIASRAFATGNLTVADPGGPYGPGYRKAFYDPFEQETGIRVTNVAREAEPTAQFKAMVDTGAYNWDVCTLTLSARDILAGLDLLEPIGINEGDFPGLIPNSLTTLWLGVDVYSSILAYRTDTIAEEQAPKNWADFWNVEGFPGRRALRKSPIDTLEQALMADGVAPADLYPLDVERAFSSLDKIRPHVDVWWTGGAQSSQLIQSGEVDMIALWNARSQAVIDGGAPVRTVWNQGLYSIEGWGIPKGSPNAEAARQFVRFCADGARQAVFTEFLSYGPTNQDAYQHIPAERAATLPTSQENLKLMTIAKEEWWSQNRAAANERFNTWILG